MPPKRKALAPSSSTSRKRPAPPSTPPPPWPPHFKSLDRVFRALNLVYTFCSTRKHLATTFDNLKSAVEAHTKAPLSVADIAQIKFLVPKSVHFEYVDGDALRVYTAGGNTERDKAYSDPGETKEKEVLLFEFVDGNPRQSIVKKLDKMKDGRRSEERAPTFSTAQMKKIIEKRNEKFSAAMDKFFKECAVAGQDPVENIQQRHRPFVPEKMHPAASAGSTTLPAEIPKERKSISEVVEDIKKEDLYIGQIVEDGHRVIEAQEAVYGDLTFQMSQELVNAIYTARNITRLYSHQAEAINSLHGGHNVIVSTSTSSGKSLIYQIPVLHELQQDRDTRAMFIFPTKALAQDQKRSLVEVLGYMTNVLGDVVVDTFDGDTPTEDRRRIRDEASVIFTNPDMLHLNILPNEEYWRVFLQNLKFVVVDELHIYTGLFGTHVAYIMRRLRRICAALGNNTIRFISCSATISNPIEHMCNIFGIDAVRLTATDGSPSGRKEFLIWNTPFKDPTDPSSGRRDSLVEAAKIYTHLLLRGVRTIAFCRVRTTCELVLQSIRQELQKLGRGDAVDKVMGYRGGYTPQDRRRIEKEMFSGHLLGIVATNALELGVDIGSLDAVIIVNFPYSLASLRQQSGRAGRRNKDSLTLLVGGSSPLDQYYMAHSSALFSSPSPPLTLELTNPNILESHLQCAAHELPLLPERDRIYFGPPTTELAEKVLDKSPETGYYNPTRAFLPHPPRHVPIRGATEETHYALIDTTNNRNTVLELLEPLHALFSLYEGAVYIHQGRPFLINSFSPTTRIACAKAVEVAWRTKARDFTDVDPVQTHCCVGFAAEGVVRVQRTVFGYVKIGRAERVLESVELDELVVVREEVKGWWVDLSSATLEVLKRRRLNAAAGIHSAAHAIIAVMQGQWRTECKAPEKEYWKQNSRRRRPGRLVFYGGSGVVVEEARELVESARVRIEGCGCHSGCVECVLAPACKEGNRVVSKTGAGVILRCILGMEVEEGGEEEGGEEGWDKGTVVPVWGKGAGGWGRAGGEWGGVGGAEGEQEKEEGKEEGERERSRFVDHVGEW